MKPESFQWLENEESEPAFQQVRFQLEQGSHSDDVQEWE